MTWTQFVLFLHILVSILAFGPPAAYGLIAAAGDKEPAHMNFALSITQLIERRLVIPLAVITPFLGLWLILLRDWDLWGSEWLVISIAIYIVGFFFSLFVLTPTMARLIRLTRTMPAAAPSADVSASSFPGGSTAQGAQDQPPEVARLAKIMQYGGIFEGLAVSAVVVLMVWKPGAAFV